MVNCAAFSPDGALLAYGGKSWVWVWNTKTGKLWSITGQIHRVLSVSFSHDNSRIVVGSTDGVRIWNHVPAKNESEGEIRGHKIDWNCLVFSPDGGWLAAISTWNQNWVKLWNATTGKPTTLCLANSSFVLDPEHTDINDFKIDGGAFFQNGERILGFVLDPSWNWSWPLHPSTLKLGSICIWNTTTGELEAELQDQSGFVSAAFFQDCNHVVFTNRQPQKAGVRSFWTYIWDIPTGSVVLEADFVARPSASPILPPSSPSPAPELENAVLAISRDGTHIDLKLGQDVAIRNVETGTSFLASTPLTLPGSGQIFRSESRDTTEEFRIIYEDEDQLNSTNEWWVVGSNSRCWIPPHEREFTKFALSKTKACFAYASGRVVILDMGGKQD